MAQRESTVVGQVVVAAIAAASILGLGAFVASSVSDGGSGTTSTTTARATGTGSTATSTPAADAPTCDQVRQLVAAGLAARALTAFEAATAANQPCPPADIAVARTTYDQTTDALDEAASLRRAGKPADARTELRGASERDRSDPRPRDVLDEMADASRDLEVIASLEDAGFHDEARAALKTFATDHPDAPFDQRASDIAEPSPPERITQTILRWSAAIVPLTVALLVAIAFARTLAARWSKRRLVLAPITRLPAPGEQTGKTSSAAAPGSDATPAAQVPASKDPKEEGSAGAAATATTALARTRNPSLRRRRSTDAASARANDRARTKAEAALGAAPPPKGAAPLAAGVVSPNVIETLIIEQMRNFRTESAHPSGEIASGPDGAIDLPAPDALPSQFGVISALSLLLPAVRGYSIVGQLSEDARSSGLALRLIQGPPERGKLRAATVITSTGSSAGQRERELASKAAAWIAFTWSGELGNDPPLKMGGTTSWQSYAHFATGLARTSDAAAAEAYTMALRSDANNVNALVNLARINVVDDPDLATRFGKRAIAVLGDDWTAQETPDICCSAFPWLYNWYRATTHVCTALLTARQTHHSATDSSGREAVREALRALDRTLQTIQAVRGRVAPPASLRPNGVDSLGPRFFEFLDRIELNMRVLRVVALVELGSERATIDDAVAAVPTLQPLASYNLGCALGRSRFASHRNAAFEHLAEAALAFGPAGLEQEPALKDLRESDQEAWAKLVRPRLVLTE